ncbi:MAG TPA: DUF72 domain-containing protein [Sphingomicrobium sp.]|nr:DUF72 domain-containing protein [Sphingomicrobium sp.]
MSEATIRIGIGGWTYPPWRGTFYPDKLPHSRELGYAAEQFGTIEINSTFYGRQSLKSWSVWEKAVPDGFQFSIKGSRYVVTRPRLADAGEGLGVYFAQGMTVLREKLGPVLWMLAARRKFDREDIAAFFKLLPSNLDGTPLRHAIEPRHESFRDDRFFALCREHDVAVVFGDDDEFPCIDADTASFAYARLQRMRETVETGYPASALADFASRAQDWRAAGRDAFIYFINGAKVRAPTAARALQRSLFV